MDGRGPFFTRLGELLEDLEAAELGRRITAYARELDRAGRQQLLAALSAPAEDAAVVESTRAAEGAGVAPDDLADDPLIEEIEAFLERVTSYEYMQGWGWDPDLHEERAWGDESWTLEMDALLEQAEHAYLSGDRFLAVEAYEAIFEIFLRDTDEPVLPGPGTATELVGTDLDRARACYLRAIYETTPAEERPGRILGAMRQIDWLGDRPVGIGDVADADAGPLPDFESFLPAWVELLEEATRASRLEGYGGWASATRWLLRDATHLMGGVDGLAELSRRSGGEHPEAYHDWIDHLLEEDRGEEALAAAEEGMDAVVEPGERALLADGAAGMARWQEFGDRELRARRVAWRAWPTGRRLRTLIRAEDESGDGHPQALERELGALRNGELVVPERAEGDPALPGRLHAALELLTGRFDEAVVRLRQAPPLGWSDPDHVGYLVFPFLLGAGADVLHGEVPGEVPAGSVLERFLEGMDRELEWSGWWSGTGGWRPRLPMTGDDELPAVRELLSVALERHSPEPEARSGFLEEAETTARQRVEAIVSNKHRRAYERAAQVAAAVAEARMLNDDPQRAQGLLVELRKTFSRYYAFTGELRSVVAGSPLLRPSAPLLE